MKRGEKERWKGKGTVWKAQCPNSVILADAYEENWQRYSWAKRASCKHISCLSRSQEPNSSGSLAGRSSWLPCSLHPGVQASCFPNLETVLQRASCSQFSAFEAFPFTSWPQVWPPFSRRKSGWNTAAWEQGETGMEHIWGPASTPMFCYSVSLLLAPGRHLPTVQIRWGPESHWSANCKL